MNDQDFLYGCRSGIQKAIRRGDVALAKTCFDVLWSKKTHRQWLKWRLPVLVVEEVWYMASQLTEFLMKASDSEMDWRRFVYRLVLAPKAKDAGVLFAVAGDSGPVEHPELEYAQFWSAMLQEDDLGAVAKEVARDLYDGYGLHSEHETNAMELLADRAAAGGTRGDRKTFIAAMILVAMRRCPKDEVQDQVEEGFEKWLEETGPSQPRVVPLPWYVFDMHTQAGLLAMQAFVKLHNRLELSKEDVSRLWFLAESAYVPPGQAKWSKMVDEPKFYQGVWWPIHLKMSLPVANLGARESLNYWRDEARPKMIRLVEWALEKRA